MDHIIIDARIRRSSTGRPIEKLVDRIGEIDSKNKYTVLLEKNDDWQPKPGQDNVFVWHVDYKQFSFSISEQVKFARLLYKLKADAVFFGMTQFPLLFFHRNITVFTHDLTMFRYAHARNTSPILHKVKLAGYKVLFWAGHRKAKHIIVPTKFVQKDLAAYQPWTKSKITQIYEAVDAQTDIKATKPNLTLLKNEKFIFFVGNAFPHKNLYRLVDAVKILSQTRPELKLVLAGKRDSYLEDLELYIKKQKVEKNVLILGFVSDNELAWLYQNALAFVYPSLSEGFGLPPLEAMAHDCPVITSDISCIPEVCGDAALYFDPINTNDIADKIEQLLDDPSLAKTLVKKGKTQIAKYSWDVMSKEIIKTIRR